MSAIQSGEVIGRKRVGPVLGWVAVLTFLGVSLWPGLSHAAPRERSNALVAYPLGGAIGRISLTYQHGPAALHGACSTGVEILDVGHSGCEAALSYRFILTGSKRAGRLGGLYVAPLVFGGAAKRIVLGSSSGTIRSVGLGFDVGYQWVFKNGLTLNLNTGWQHRLAASGTADLLDFPRLASPGGGAEWWPGVGVGIGYSF